MRSNVASEATKSIDAFVSLLRKLRRNNEKPRPLRERPGLA